MTAEQAALIPAQTARAPVSGLAAAMGIVVQHQVLRQRQMWWSPIVSGLANPLFFLFAIGAGIGSQIDDGELVALGTDSFFAWVGPGILAVTALDVGAREAMWPTEALLRWQGIYRAVLYTPMGAGHLAVAHLGYIACRAMLAALCYLAILVATGVPNTWWAAAVPIVGGAIAVAHAAPIVAFSGAFEVHNVFPALQRVVVFPLFLFSGAFFPVSEMPAPLATIARYTPSWHGVEACRDMILGSADSSTLGHVAVVTVVALVGIGVAGLVFDRKFTP